MTRSERMRLAGAIRRAPLEIRESIVDALLTSGWGTLLKIAADAPSGVVKLQGLDGGKVGDAGENGDFHISDRSFGHLSLSCESDGRWMAQQAGWYYDSASLIGAGYYSHRLDGLRNLLGQAHDSVALAHCLAVTVGRRS